MIEQKQVEEIIKRAEKMKSDRSQWESHWEEVATYVAPRYGGISTTNTKGGKRMEQVFDCTAVDANDVFASGMYGHLCNGRWFLLKDKNPESQESWWFGEASRILLEELAMSNYGQMIHEYFKKLGSIGTGCLFEEQGKPGSPALNFREFNIKNYYILENSKGLVDTLYRFFQYTARQAVQEWGEDNVGQSVLKAYKDKKEDLFDFWHAIFPREERDDTKRDKENMPFASIYIAVKDKKVIEKGGYPEQPFMVTRIDKESDEKYGRSIGMKMLPEIKLLNKMVKTTLKAAEKVVDPPLQVPDDGFISPFKTVPGGLMYYRAGTQDRVDPLNTNANIGLGLEMEDKRRDAIKRSFFNDLFLLLADKKNMTATEVLERVEEKLLLLGPMLGRLQSELFNPLIDRTVGILARAGKLPPVPAGIEEYEIEYLGKLAIAMRLVEVKAIREVMGYIEPFAATNPAVMDNFDEDKIVRGISERLGVASDWLRDSETIEGIRASRAEQAQMQQMLEAGGQIADAVPKLGKKIEEGSALGMMQ